MIKLSRVMTKAM